MTLRNIAFGALSILLSGSAMAQTSPSFRLEEHALNAGGSPAHAAEIASASFRVTLSSLGDSVPAVGLGSTSFQIDSGFGTAYRAPGEVAALCGGGGECLRFTAPQTLGWPAERSAGVYTLYRDDSGPGYGVCRQQDLAGTTATDAAAPSVGEVFFYLVTVQNRLAEEGTKGFDSSSAERLGAGGLPECE